MTISTLRLRRKLFASIVNSIGFRVLLIACFFGAIFTYLFPSLFYFSLLPAFIIAIGLWLWMWLAPNEILLTGSSFKIFNAGKLVKSGAFSKVTIDTADVLCFYHKGKPLLLIKADSWDNTDYIKKKAIPDNSPIEVDWFLFDLPGDSRW